MSSQERNAQIDGLRGIMCLLIVLYHLVFRYQQLYGDPEVHPFLLIQYWGRFGVAVFFAISAYFLYSDHLLESGLLHFYKKKFFRLWCPYIISISITYLISCLYTLPGRGVTIKDFILNLFFVNGFVGIEYVDGAHWYLTVLISMIFVVGIINKIGIQEKCLTYIIWILCGIICYSTFLRPILKFFGGSYIALTVSGIMIHRIILERKRKESSFVLGIALISSLIMGIDTFIIDCLACLLLYLAARGKAMLFKNSFLVFIGTSSYTIYLIHQNIGMTLEYGLSSRFGFEWLTVAIAIIAVSCLGFLIGIVEKHIRTILADRITLGN